VKGTSGRAAKEATGRAVKLITLTSSVELDTCSLDEH